MNEFVTLNRRELLKTTTGLLTGLVLAGGPLALIARGRAWAVELAALTSAEGATLMAMTRTIAPHDKLEQAAYAMVVKAIDGEASTDEKTSRMIKGGLFSLGPEFAASAEDERVTLLKKIEATDFFQAVRLKTMQVLYSTPLAYAYFGYEGEAFSKGGYLLRGFNDLHWLPEVPTEDSGALPAGS